MKICIVTPDYPGFINNGGIGTACHHLAHLLAQEHHVHVLYTTPIHLSNRQSLPNPPHPNISIHTLQNQPSPYPKINGGYFIKNSLLAYHWLKERDFDLIHFQDWQANGFFSIQAKRTGLAFQNTLLALTMHSNSQWIREGSLELIRDPYIQPTLDYMERYCHRYCDRLISPSHHLLNWAQKKQWPLCPSTHILPYAFTEKLSQSPPTTYSHDHLIFFGRLETRKGVHIFCNAIDTLLEKIPISKITFLGKYGTIHGQHARAYLAPFLKRWRKKQIHIRVITTFGHDQALNYICQHPGILIIPSLIDNLPYTVIESIEHQLPFLAARTGGIPEMADPRWLFEPTTEALAQAIAEIPTRFPEGYTPNHLYQSHKANSQLLEFHRQLARELVNLKTKPTPPLPTPKVSVCISHYNHGKYLPQLLSALKKQDYPNFEVLVRDDASTDSQSRDVFNELEKKYPRFVFYRNPQNLGLANTRNANAEAASGELLLFMDSDNLPGDETMISRFVIGLQKSRADVCTSHNVIFKGDALPSWPQDFIDAYIPIGACIELGFIRNVFGDANFIVRKASFQAVGGFLNTRAPLEDWEFLARASLLGCTVEVIPEPLFHYRYLPNSMLRTKSYALGLRNILETYSKHSSAIPIGQILEITAALDPFTHRAICFSSKRKKPPLRKAWHFIKGTFKVITGQKRL